MSLGLAGLYNIVANKGATLSRTILWKDPAKKSIKLVGYTARMQVRLTPDSDEVILELTTENGGITLGDSDGSVTLYASPETMEAITSDQYMYDLELIAPVSNIVYKLLNGNFVVRTEVTR
jgi:hypothetical protein